MSRVWSEEPAKDEEALKRKYIDAKGRGVLFSAVKVTSDPPGAEVYDDRGSCWGQRERGMTDTFTACTGSGLRTLGLEWIHVLLSR